SGVLTDDPALVDRGRGRTLVIEGQVQARRQQRPLRPLVSPNELGNTEDLGNTRCRNRRERHGRVGRAEIDPDDELGFRARRHYSGLSFRTLSSTLKHSPGTRGSSGNASSSNVPTGVIDALSRTGTKSPAWRPSASKVTEIGESSTSSSSDQSSSSLPVTSSRRTVEPKKRNSTASPTMTPSSCGRTSGVEPSSSPNGATQ